MPHFYFHVHDRFGAIRDETGAELEDRAEAYRYVLDSVRSIIADDMKRGHLALDGRVDVTDADGAPLFSLNYRDAFHEHTASATQSAHRPAAIAPRRSAIQFPVRAIGDSDAITLASRGR